MSGANPAGGGRVVELAKELKLDNGSLLAVCRELGFEKVKNQLNTLSSDQAEKVRRRVAEGPWRGQQLTVQLPAVVKMTFVWCPPGTFLMGSSESEQDRGDDEQQHEVRLTKGFFTGVHPVTQAQWKVVMNTDPCHFKGPELPVENVSWDDAQAFCKKLGELTGKAIRLPTEAEWEYVCRGGTKTAFYWGNELNGIQACCNGKSPYGRVNASRTADGIGLCA